AAAALATLGAGPRAEAALLALLQRSASARERAEVARAFGKVGREVALAALDAADPGAARRVRARLARERDPSGVDLDAVLSDLGVPRVRLRVRAGFEEILAGEVAARWRGRGPLRVAGVEACAVVLAPRAPFALRDLYALRCFDDVGFELGHASSPADADAFAAAVTSPAGRRLLEACTRGTLRYRIEIAGGGHRRALVRALAGCCAQRWPELLNDPSRAPWTIEVRPRGARWVAEAVPHVAPDPRLRYRVADVPAASHPRLAACMARLAAPRAGDDVLDPCCGSGLELVECALLANVRSLHGCDRSESALDAARRNVAAAGLRGVRVRLTHGDFRDLRAHGIAPRSFDVVLTNPPMGRRVRTASVTGVLVDLLAVAAVVLRPGGRLVFPSPIEPPAAPAGLVLRSRHEVDFGGFPCRLSVYERRG
ncbi:MAG TPA: methyltransferase, partial [Planctomycetota bacterium]|nr:methyltransferase [Planctomycetota bacterium]